MNRRFAILACLTAATALVLATTGFAARFNRVVDIGDKAYSWKDLEGVDGSKHSLDELKDAKAVVVIFTCNHCPVAKAYEPRFIEFTKDYQDKGVAVVAINCNTIPADRLDKMKERAEESGFNFSYLYDPEQEVGKAYGASVTPHLFVLDQDRKIAYMGALDDNLVPGKVDEQYVRNAVDAVLADETPEVTETKPLGCTIQYN